MKKSIYVWGIGYRTKKFIDKEQLEIDKVCGFIDSYAEISEFMGKPVFLPEKFSEMNMEYDFIFVASKFSLDIKRTCDRLNFDLNKVIFSFPYIDVASRQKFDVLKHVFPELYRNMEEYRLKTHYVMEMDYLTERKSSFEEQIYEFDYFRYRTFELLVAELNRENISGSVAEFGVFYGGFARVINKLFPDKTLYLFDSFDGFRETEAEHEKELGYCDDKFISGYKNINVEKVMERMPYPDNIRIRQGFFPETTEGLENERYCFVSLDVDFGDSTYEGLKYFYPRVNEHGYIMIHDYNSHLGGVACAVDKYEKETNCKLNRVPIADHYGTLIIVK